MFTPRSKRASSSSSTCLVRGAYQICRIIIYFCQKMCFSRSPKSHFKRALFFPALIAPEKLFPTVLNGPL